MSLLPHTLALARQAFGISLLILPRPLAALSRLPFPDAASAVLGMRLAGGRDFAVGYYLWHALRRRSASLLGDSGLDAKSMGRVSADESTPLAPTGKVEGGNREASTAVRDALMLGIAVDSIDVLSCLACYVEGDLNGVQTLVFGGMAGGLVLAGGYCWRNAAAGRGVE